MNRGYDVPMRGRGRWLALSAILLVCTTTTAASGGNPAESEQMSTLLAPRRGDTDGDGLTDAAEARRYHTDPHKRDTDGDRVSDGAEVERYHINPRKADTDRDGVQDGDELKRYHSDPRKRDTDGDRLRDGDEVDRYKTNPRKADTDSDGLRDPDEVNRYKTNPRKADTDSDGFGDRVELRGGTNPLNARSRLGYPDTSNTGVPAETSLKPTEGFSASTNNAVYDGLDISGTVTVTATNVTIKNSRISNVGFFGVDIEGGSVTLQNVEIDCGRTGTKGILNGNFTAIGVNIHNCEDGVFAGGDFTIRDSYIHDLATSETAHNDGIQAIDAINITIEHNRVDGTDTSAIWLNNNSGGPLAQNVLVQDNLLAGAGWTLYCPAEASSNVRILNNAFSLKLFPKVGLYGPATDCGDDIQSGNVYHETGEPLTLG
jgi:hypothetical protein